MNKFANIPESQGYDFHDPKTKEKLQHFLDMVLSFRDDLVCTNSFASMSDVLYRLNRLSSYLYGYSVPQNISNLVDEVGNNVYKMHMHDVTRAQMSDTLRRLSSALEEVIAKEEFTT